jgi:preprotein translocase subunit SecD
MKKIILGLLFLFSVSGMASIVEIKTGSKVLISMKDISEVRPIERADGTWDVFLQLNSNATKKFEALTKRLQGKKLDILIDNELISSPVIQIPINSGSIQLGARYTKESAIETAEKIREELKAKK